MTQDIEDQNKQALENQQYFADWESVSIKFNPHRGTTIGEYQKLDRLQAIKKTKIYGDCA